MADTRQLSSCNCGSGPSVQEVCGDFDADTNTPDLGQCAPYRTKIPCAAPVKPQNPCNDENAYAESRPNQNPKFVIVATIFDENCLPILDENNAPIMAEYQSS